MARSKSNVKMLASKALKGDVRARAELKFFRGRHPEAAIKEAEKCPVVTAAFEALDAAEESRRKRDARVIRGQG